MLKWWAGGKGVERLAVRRVIVVRAIDVCAFFLGRSMYSIFLDLSDGVVVLGWGNYRFDI